MVGARAGGFYAETIHSVSPAVPRISDVDNTTTTATSAPSLGSWKCLHLAHPFFCIPTSITNACGLTTKDGQSTASSDLFQGAGRLAHGTPQDQVMTAFMVAEFSLESH